MIQKADERALKGGVCSLDVFELAMRVRRSIDTPLAIMTYANVVYSMGISEYARAMKESGFDALILPDVPFEEKKEFSDPVKAEDIDFISLIAPTSHERIKAISREADGFVYVVSSLGVTGMRDVIESDIASMVRMVKSEKNIPAAVGFGISRPGQAYDMALKSDGVIVGSAIVRICEEYGRDSIPYVSEYVKEMKAAVMRADGESC